jgi:hypothetical protein
LKATTPIHEYEPATWGPTGGDDRVVPEGGWHNPTMEIVDRPRREAELRIPA